MSKLSLVVITKNAAKYLDRCLESVKGLTNTIILVDDNSTDLTHQIAKKYNAHIYSHHERNFGKQRAFSLTKTKTEWVLVLDADEFLPDNLKNEIKKKIKNKKSEVSGYYIPFQTHLLSKPLHHGGENYKKLALFKKDSVTIKSLLVHEKYELIKGKSAVLKYKANHYSYESLIGMYSKFTDYAIREADQKAKNNERSSIKKVLLYPLHMFWARFIKDRGYKDGLFRIPLDLGFAYMEFVTYLLLMFKKK